MKRQPGCTSRSEYPSRNATKEPSPSWPCNGRPGEVKTGRNRREQRRAGVCADVDRCLGDGEGKRSRIQDVGDRTAHRGRISRSAWRSDGGR